LAALAGTSSLLELLLLSVSDSSALPVVALVHDELENRREEALLFVDSVVDESLEL